MMQIIGEYPEQAYAPDGVTLWWELDVRPGARKAKFGAEGKLATWLAFNVELGETFTMPQLRHALGDGVIPHEAEHLNRRLRSLRDVGWTIPTTKDNAALGVGEYELVSVGWHPGLGPRPARNSVSKTTRRLVFERDNSRCVICGVAATEPYPDGNGATCVITVGHRIPNARRGSSKDLNNLQTECKHCNEPIRQENRSPDTLDEVLPTALGLKRSDAKRLEGWLEAGHRTRDNVDEIYDRIRRLNQSEKDELLVAVRKKVGS